MGREIRANYDQVLMFPPCVEDWVGEDHPARFIRSFVDMLDLRALGFCMPDSDVGRPAYACDMLLEIWLYGYFNKIRSTRKLEKACREHMGMIWLTGTKIRSASSREGVESSVGLEKLLERLDRSIGDFMTEIERQEQEETGQYRLPSGMCSALKRKDRIGKALMELEESERKRIHHREPEARFMKNRRSIEPSFNGQAVADKNSGIIVAQDVVTDETDNGLLVPMLDKVKENMGMVAQENLADSGYYSSPQIGLAEERKASSPAFTMYSSAFSRLSALP